MLNQNRFTVVNTWLRFLLETYLELTIASVLAFFSQYIIQDMKLGDKIALYIAYITAIIIGIFTIFVAV